MPNDRPTEPAGPSASPGTARWFTDIIDAVKRPISFFTLSTLVFLVAFLFTNERDLRLYLLGALMVLVLIVTLLLVRFPDVLFGDREVSEERPPPTKPKELAPEAKRSNRDSALVSQSSLPAGEDIDILARVRRLDADIYGAEKKPPDLDSWYKYLQPTLHQAVFYTVPTYFLDPDLYILDYNLAFEIIFRRPACYLRGRHVNWFIAQLANHDDVHEHGRKFTERVKRENSFPLVDLEPIVYDSPDFGPVEFTKVASQLHDTDGRLQGWAVALMLRRIDWDSFERKLEEKLRQDKLWSVYSAAYDRMLEAFPPYLRLTDEVIAVLSGENLLVADLGAGTGNTTRALLAKGHRVAAIENNLGMLDRLRAKQFTGSVTIVKDSIENCERLREEIFDGVVMVNVLYAVDDPLGCLKEVHRVLKPGGVLGFSTTHSETQLDELLGAIRAFHKQRPDRHRGWRADFDTLEKVNRDIEKTIARRHTRDDYQQFVRAAGFEVTQLVPSTYHQAVMVLHARKR